ncbi:hypothetical protein F183_A22140 [Bryobacterales bacterium F-183]|nr:hypothetical protein F183_A22140 [Bryobacterales bacterium F-183]
MTVALAMLLTLAQVTPELRQAAESGMKARQSGDLATAAAEFRKITQMAPNLAAGFANLGAVYFEQKDYVQSVPTLRRALELNANLPGTRTQLGTALLATGYAVEAIPYLEASPELLGIALLEGGREREAIDRLEAALQTKPKDPDLLFYLGQAHSRLAGKVFAQVTGVRAVQLSAEAAVVAGRREQAAKAYAEVIAKRPDLLGMHLALGELALESGDFATAGKEFEKEVKLAPGSARAAWRYGAVLLNQGNNAAALSELRRANQLQPDMPETLLDLGKAELAAGSLPNAQQAFEKLLAIEQETLLAENAHLQLSNVYRRLNRPADAERHAKLFRELRQRRTVSDVKQSK